MNLFALILYGTVNLLMVSHCLLERGRYYQFPFWAGMIALGWFYPQAIGGYLNVSDFPPNAYADSMFFATVCTIALWGGFTIAIKRHPSRASWLEAPFDASKLYYAAVMLCGIGFFFQWKLWSLPEEMLAETQWSGATVKYFFLASVFKIGFAVLWILYISQPRLFVPKLLIFIVPCLLLFFEAAVLRGRRAGMMDLVAYLIVSLWFVRRITLPRWFIVTGLLFGLILINGIRVYREILMNKDEPFSKRLTEAVQADYFETSRNVTAKSGAEFRNYIFYLQVTIDSGFYDWGAKHWNRFVHNYVPGQIIGHRNKENLMLRPTEIEFKDLAYMNYGHKFHTGTTTTGYRDAYSSFGWFGFIKFFLIGWMMGILYRYAMQGAFLGQLLYIYALTTGMQAVSHGTNDILIRVWVYFFVLGYPVLYLAKAKRHDSIVEACGPA